MRPNEATVQSAGVPEEQVFFIEYDDKANVQFSERKKQSLNNPNNTETIVQIDSISGNTFDETLNVAQKVCRTNQILLEQCNDPILQQLKAQYKRKIFREKSYSNIFGIHIILTTWTECSSKAR